MGIERGLDCGPAIFLRVVLFFAVLVASVLTGDSATVAQGPILNNPSDVSTPSYSQAPIEQWVAPQFETPAPLPVPLSQPALAAPPAADQASTPDDLFSDCLLYTSPSPRDS